MASLATKLITKSPALINGASRAASSGLIGMEKPKLWVSSHHLKLHCFVQRGQFG